MKHLILPAVGLLAAATSANAAVVYVDAITGTGASANTTLANGTAYTPAATSATNNDDWDLRAFANGGTILASNGAASGSEDAPRIRTTIGSLTPGATYDIYTYFWGSSSWRGRTSLTNPAGDIDGYNSNHFAASSFSPMTFVTASATSSTLNPGPLSTATGSGSVAGGDANKVESGGYFTASNVLSEEGNRSLYQVSLGTAVANGSGEIAVYIDDLVTGSNGNRTWYDGVGYELVPEPASAALVGLGALAVVGRRRRA